MIKKYIVALSAEERKNLLDVISSGKDSARKILRAHALLKTDEGWTDQRISEAFNLGIRTLEKLRRRLVEEGFDTALNNRKSKRQYKCKLDGKQEAQLITLACSEAPDGHARWSLRLLAGQMVSLDYVENVSHECVRNVLKKRAKALA